jgi:hypothetical protein
VPDINRIRTSAIVDDDGLGRLEFDFTGYLTGRRGVITRMIAGVAVGVGELADLASDSFTRTVVDGWGSADVGGTYALSGVDPAANFDVDGDEGTITGGTQGAHLATLPLALTNCTMLATFVNLGTGGAGDRYGLAARYVDVNNFVVGGVSGNASPWTIYIRQVVGGVDTLIVSTTKALTFPVNCRFTLDDQVLSVRAWNDDGTPEPADFDIATGATPAAVAGSVGCYYNAPAGVFTRRYDDFLVSTAEPANPTWDAYIGDTQNPGNLIDSSQGVVIPRWVPALVNGQPVSQGDILTIVAIGGTPGSQLVASCYLSSEVVPAGST